MDSRLDGGKHGRRRELDLPGLVAERPEVHALTARLRVPDSSSAHFSAGPTHSWSRRASGSRLSSGATTSRSTRSASRASSVIQVHIVASALGNRRDPCRASRASRTATPSRPRSPRASCCTRMRAIRRRAAPRAEDRPSSPSSRSTAGSRRAGAEPARAASRAGRSGGGSPAADRPAGASAGCRRLRRSAPSALVGHADGVVVTLRRAGTDAPRRPAHRTGHRARRASSPRARGRAARPARP